MTGGTSAGGRVGLWCLRFCLSSVFVYAGAVKTWDAQAFAESVASFRLLPISLVVPVAITLPPLETLAGLLALSAGRGRRVGALVLAVLPAVFAVVLLSALARGLQVDCGCFGPDRLDLLSPTKNLWFAVGRDVVLTAVGWFLYADSLKETRPVSMGAERA